MLTQLKQEHYAAKAEPCMTECKPAVEITQRARVKGAKGGWQSKLDAVNELVDDMVQPITEVARVIGAVAQGDLSQTMALEVDGGVVALVQPLSVLAARDAGTVRATITNSRAGVMPRWGHRLDPVTIRIIGRGLPTSPQLDSVQARRLKLVYGLYPGRYHPKMLVPWG